MVQGNGASAQYKCMVRVHSVKAWVQVNGIDIDIDIGIGIDISIDAGVGDLCHQQYVLYLYQNMFFFCKGEGSSGRSRFCFLG